jgi:hypothetical protein
MKRTLTVALLAAALSVAAPVGVAQAQDCARLPYGASGCDAYLGAKVRLQLRQHGLPVMLTDAQIGRAVVDLCTMGRVRAPAAQSYAWLLDQFNGPYCG